MVPVSLETSCTCQLCGEELSPLESSGLFLVVAGLHKLLVEVFHQDFSIHYQPSVQVGSLAWQ